MAKILTERSFVFKGADGVAVSNSWVAACFAQSIAYVVFGTDWRDFSDLGNEAFHLVDELVAVLIGEHIHCSGEWLTTKTGHQEIRVL